jgi:apolipoprotein N-acyltransferase
MTDLRPIDRSKLFLAVLSGVLMTAAFPRSGWFWMAWVALIPLLLALRDLKAVDAFRLGWLCGIVHAVGLLYWLVHTLSTYGHLPLALAAGILLFFCTYIGLFTALFSLLLTFLGRTPGRTLAAAPLLWAGLEYLRSFLLTGFTWGYLGHTQYRWLTLIQSADIWGVYGLSALIVVLNTALFLLVLSQAGKTWQGQPVFRSLAGRALLLAAACLIANLGYGWARFNQIQGLEAQASTLRIGLAQGNIPQSEKWDPAFQIASTKTYLHLSSELAPKNPDLIVWPETATPFYLFHNQALTRIVQRGIRDTDSAHLIGSPAVERKADGTAYFNSAYLLDAAGTALGRYDKAHLVPFGEYVPLKRWLPFLGKIVAQVGDFHAGPPGGTLAFRDHRIGPLICYDGIFPDLSRAAVANGADLLVNLTNDAWYGRTSAPYQHLVQYIFRAVETRRSLVRATNTGISAFIRPGGQIENATDLFQTAARIQTVACLAHRTFYVRFGDAFALVCLAVLGAMGLQQWRRRRKNSGSPPPL